MPPKKRRKRKRHMCVHGGAISACRYKFKKIGNKYYYRRAEIIWRRAKRPKKLRQKWYRPVKSYEVKRRRKTRRKKSASKKTKKKKAFGASLGVPALQNRPS